MSRYLQLSILLRSNLWPLNGMKMCVYCYYFCLEPMVGKETCMRKNPVAVMIFWKWHSVKLLNHVCIKSPFSINYEYEAHWQQHFERYPAVLYFTDMGQYAHAKSLMKILVNITEWRPMKVPEKISVAQNPSAHFEERCTSK